LTAVFPTDQLPQGIRQVDRRKSHREVLEFFMIQGQDDKIYPGQVTAVKMRKFRFGKSLRQFHLPLTTPAAKNNRITILNHPHWFSSLVHPDKRLH